MRPAEAITLRVPDAAEMPRLREFLPFAFLPGGKPSWLVASRPGQTELLGAWCLLWMNAQQREAGFFWRMTLPELGPVMMQRMLQAATKAGIRRLTRMQMIWERSPDCAFLEQYGFRVTDTVHWYEAERAALESHIESVYQLLRARNRLPDLEIKDFEAHHIPAVKEIVLRHRLAPGFEFEHKAGAGSGGYSREVSVLLARGNKIHAVLLATIPEPGVAEIDIRIVDEVGGTAFGANAVLLREALRRGAALGLQCARFRGHTVDHRETGNLARRSGARSLGCQLYYVRDL